MEVLRGGLVAGSVPRVDKPALERTVQNVFNTRLPEGSEPGGLGPTTLAHAIGTSRTIELQHLRYQWSWPVPPPTDEILDPKSPQKPPSAGPEEEGEGKEKEMADTDGVSEPPPPAAATPAVSPSRVQRVTNIRGEELDANGEVVMPPKSYWVRKTPSFFECFPYVCPEPVLAK